jgi:S1-C subfamily serine protease
VKLGDVLVEVQGKPVADPTGMLNLIAALAPGQPAKLRLKRHGQDVSATVTVGRRPKPQVRAAE